MDFLRIVGSLFLVFGLLAAMLWGLKRLQLRVQPGGADRRLQVLESLSVGPRQKLALVRVGEQEVLLGISPGQINALGQWSGSAQGLPQRLGAARFEGGFDAV